MPASKPAPILLIGDDAAARRELATKLEFLGESVQGAAWLEWPRAAPEAKEFPVVFVLASAKASERETLADLLAHFSRSAIVLLDADELPDCVDDSARARMFAAAGAAAHFRELLDVLHKARLCHQCLGGSADAEVSSSLAAAQGLIGSSPAITAIREMVARLSGTEVNVLITGESGTGKEIVARSLHRVSGREGKAFVPVNCGAIPGELLESELFGHERGAFTGAVATSVGRFERAHGGTLFLDEIGDMPLNMQVKLLRVLEEGSFERVGGNRSIRADARILAATHKNLEEMIACGEFREDLYYRINVFPLQMPPLRERAEDIPLLLNDLIGNLESAGKGSVRFNSAAISALCGHRWPGNVREFANLIERMAILHPHGIVGLEQLPERLRGADGQDCKSEESPRSTQASPAPAALRPTPPTSMPPASMPPVSMPPVPMPPIQSLDLKRYLANLEKDFIERALQDSNGVVKHAAERLRLGRTTLIEKMRRHGIGRGN